MNLLSRLLLSVLFSLGFYAVQAQSIKISGKIVNEKNEVLPGVTVKIAGSAGGAISDLDGRFSLNLSTGKKYELQLSAVGYETKTITDVEVQNGQLNELNIVLA